jgi:predicted nuclease of restriction endonuclease-like (RecB) superfamily
MRAFAEDWPELPILQQPVGELPWGHNLVLLAKLKDEKPRLAYAQAAIEHGWSRNVLVHHIELRTSFPRTCSCGSQQTFSSRGYT